MIPSMRRIRTVIVHRGNEKYGEIMDQNGMADQSVDAAIEVHYQPELESTRFGP